jgi:hypothetical protein
MANDGGPAFPSLDIWEQYNEAKCGYSVTSEVTAGMTLRDYFAAHALVGLISNKQWAKELIGSTTAIDAQWRAARVAYQLADAMLKARDQK